MGLMRSIADLSNGIICRAKRGRRYEGGAGTRLNLGCGLAVAKGWLNVDGSLNSLFAPWPRFAHRALYKLSGSNRYYTEEQYCSILGGNTFLHWDLAYGLPFRDASVDFIFTSHFLEHLFRKDAVNILREAHRVLRPGGLIRISVPDLAHAVEMYAAGKKKEMLENYFFVEDLGSFLARHKYMYDFELLKEALAEAGFGNIRREAYRSGRVPDLEQLDNRPEDSLFVEAER